jgi:hypothetical protein
MFQDLGVENSGIVEMYVNTIPLPALFLKPYTIPP